MQMVKMLLEKGADIEKRDRVRTQWGAPAHLSSDTHRNEHTGVLLVRMLLRRY